mmetsp:Transcript_78749/g.109100  ORF Transcript_78749/g.109100 Transcript_78749/m.109100 type:complete len:121 (+) Transcript_78749:156-518(+)
MHFIWKQLAEDFYCIFPDVYGFGLSSAPKVDIKSTEQAIDFIADWIEAWRKAMDITDFYLLGHSFGGQIAGIYAVKYRNHIKKLFLASPIGTEEHPEGLSNYDVMMGPNKTPKEVCDMFV